MKNLAIVCCLHGNERYGFEVSRNQSFFPFFLANKKAFIENNINENIEIFEVFEVFEIIKKFKNNVNSNLQ